MNIKLPLSNVQQRDIDSLLHPNTPLHTLGETGALVIERGQGVFIYDTQGNEYIEACPVFGVQASALATKS